MSRPFPSPFSSPTWESALSPPPPPQADSSTKILEVSRTCDPRALSLPQLANTLWAVAQAAPAAAAAHAPAAAGSAGSSQQAWMTDAAEAVAAHVEAAAAGSSSGSSSGGSNSGLASGAATARALAACLLALLSSGHHSLQLGQAAQQLAASRVVGSWDSEAATQQQQQQQQQAWERLAWAGRLMARAGGE